MQIFVDIGLRQQYNMAAVQYSVRTVAVQ